MNFHIITIFPEAFDSFTKTSIVWNSIKNNLFNIEFYKLSDFSTKNFKHVDDKAYWMHWQVISPEPLSKAIDFIRSKILKAGYPQGAPLQSHVGFTPCEYPGKIQIPIIYMSPSWNLLNQEKVENYYSDFKDMDIIIICWHYEWIDERIIEKYVTHQISIWEYVLTSWEIAATVFIDSLVRHIPNVLWNPQSLEEDSFSKFFDRQKEHPVYTRPKIFEEMEVPRILTSWNHIEIEKWKQNNNKK